MTTHNFSIEDLALALIVRLDRKNIFPPKLNDPESFLTPTDSLTNLSFRRPKRSPNAFLVCRKNVHEEAMRRGTFNMRVISKVTGILWKEATPQEKAAYKKLADQVYEIHYRRTSSIYKKMMNSSLKESPSYKPYYSFPVQSTTAVPPQVPVQEPLMASPAPPPVSPVSPVSPLIPLSDIPSTLNFDLEESIDLNSYNNFNNQIIPYSYYQPYEENQLLPYFINNVLVYPDF